MCLWKFYQAKHLQVLIIMIIPLVLVVDSQINEVYILPDTPFNISCDLGRDHKKVNFTCRNFDKYRNCDSMTGELKRFSHDLKTLNFTATHPGIRWDKNPWRVYAKTANKSCGFIITTGYSPARPQLIVNETENFNYKVIKLKWKIFPQDKSNRTILINRSFANLSLNGKPLLCVDDFNIDNSGEIKCTATTEVPPGAVLTGHLVSEKSDLNANAKSKEFTLDLDEYVIPDKVKNLTVNLINSTSAILEWSPPYSVAAVKYQIKYSSEFDLKEKTVNLTNETSLILQDLCANSKYSFTITAYSPNSRASPEVEGAFNTSCSVPKKVDVTSNSYEIIKQDNAHIAVEIYWKLYRCDYGCTDLQFRIILKSDNDEYGNNKHEQTYNATDDSRSMVIEKLMRGSTYRVTIKATNSEGEGDASDDIIIKAVKHDVKPPPNFTVIWYKTEVKLYWDHRESTLYTIYACTSNERSSKTSVNRIKRKVTYKKVFWKEVGEKNEASLLICPEDPTQATSRDYEQECIHPNDKSQTEIGIAYHQNTDTSPILWATCMYDNETSPEVPDFNVEPYSSSLILRFDQGVPPCKKPGRYFHKYLAQVYNANITNDKQPVKEIILNRNDKQYTISNLESSHFYSVQIIGIAWDDRKEVLAKRDTATTAGELLDLSKLGWMAIALISMLIAVALIRRRRIKTQTKVNQLDNGSMPRERLDSSSSDEDYQDENQLAYMAKEAGDYDDLNMENLERISLGGFPTVRHLEVVPMLPKKTGLKLKTDESTIDSAFGDTLSKNDVQQIERGQEITSDSVTKRITDLQSEPEGITGPKGITEPLLSSEGVGSRPTDSVDTDTGVNTSKDNASDNIGNGTDEDSEVNDVMTCSSDVIMGNNDIICMDGDVIPGLSHFLNSDTAPTSSDERCSKRSNASDSGNEVGFSNPTDPNRQSPQSELEVVDTSDSFGGLSVDLQWPIDNQVTSDKSCDSAEGNYD